MFLIPDESGRHSDLELIFFFKEKNRRNIAVFRLQGLKKEFLFLGFLDESFLVCLFFLNFY